jgi:pilus assembly protein CpaE
MSDHVDTLAWGFSRVLLLTSAGDDATQIQTVISEALGRAAVVERCTPEKADAKRVGRADLVMLAESSATEIVEQVKRIGEFDSHRPVLAVLSDGSRSAIQEVLRAGASEVLFAPLRAGELIRVLMRLAEERTGGHRGKATVCTINSLTGGAGVTTIAIGLATALQKTYGRRTVLVDLDVQSAGIASALEVEPEQTMANLGRAQKLDSIELEAALSRHASGVYLLAGPRHIDDHEAVTPDLMVNIITVMREIFDFVIIDGGRQIDERMLAVWENSDRLLYILSQSVNSVRSFLRVQDLIRRLEVKAPRPQLVLNRHRADLGITPDQISDTLEQPIMFRIASDEKAAHAFNAAGDLWKATANSQLVRSLDKMAARIAGADDNAHSGHSRLAPLLRMVRGNA